jgi:hypothetical protein
VICVCWCFLLRYLILAIQNVCVCCKS